GRRPRRARCHARRGRPVAAPPASSRRGRAASPAVVPAPAGSAALTLLILVVPAAAEADLLLDRVHSALDRALALLLGPLLLALLEEIGDALGVVDGAKVEPVD